MKLENPSREQFNDKISKGKTLVDFWASWCGPCRIQSEINERLIAERKDIDLITIDVDVDDETAQDFGVVNIPTLVCFSDGAVVEKFVGVTDLTALSAVFDK